MHFMDSLFFPKETLFVLAFILHSKHSQKINEYHTDIWRWLSFVNLLASYDGTGRANNVLG